VPDPWNESISEGHGKYDSLEWIARLTSHILEGGAQLVQYYGAYSNAHRGFPLTPKKPENTCLMERRKSWARFIHSVYEVDL
jgi:hypothetical protein